MSPVAANYLGIPGYFIFWVLFAVAFGLFIQRVWLLVRLLKLGRSENRFDRLASRFFNAFLITFFQWCNFKNVTRKDRAGIAHAFMFWGFCLFLLSYVIFIGFGGGFGFCGYISGTAFDTVYSSILDIAAVVIIVALIFAVIRRYVIKPKRLQGHSRTEATIILALVGSLMLLHLFVEGFNISVRGLAVNWPPIGAALASLFEGVNWSQSALLVTYKSLWWAHYLVILSFMVFIPRSKHLHILASFVNVAFKSSMPKGALSYIDISNTQNLGAAKIQDFSWKQLLDGYACAVCGRCHADCPAQVSGKPLSPREIILKLKEHLLKVGTVMLKAQVAAVNLTATPASSKPIDLPKTEAASKIIKESSSLIGNVITEDEIWSCTTCGACQEVCPSYNEQMSKIIEMRRHLQMAAITETGKDTLKNMRVRGHPWRGTMYSRAEWAEGLDIKVVGKDSNIGVLFWVGCTGALEDRSLKVTQVIARLLKQAGVDFGILGEEEICCGDPARRLGGEHIFQMLAMNNIQLLQGYNVKKILTACPHCFNTLKNEYPQLGAQSEVVHHTQFIGQLIKEGKLKLTSSNNSIITFHDSCYLGRYNDIYQEPRGILKNIPGVKLVEMEKNLKNSFCCGGGGGRMWLEEKIGKRIGEVRLNQAMDKKAQIVATACPYCLQIFEDAAKAEAVEETLKIKDIAELVAESVSGSAQS